MKSKNSILAISHVAYRSLDDYHNSLTYKLFHELEKYYYVSYTLYQKKAKEVGHGMTQLPFSWSSFIQRFLNILFIYYNNIKHIYQSKSDLIWLRLASGLPNAFCFIYPLIFPRKKFYVQLFTPSVHKYQLYRNISDLTVRFNLLFFNFIGGDSETIRTRYRVPEKKKIHTKCGMSDYGFQNKDFRKLSLVYIGTLTNREVWKSIQGLAIFIMDHPRIDISYEIIGGGAKRDIEKIETEIKNLGLHTFVKYHGVLTVEEVKRVFSTCNIGVSYVPINDYFQNSSTKTIEYMLNGMSVIATKNKFRSLVIDRECGVLCQDNPEDFAKALKEIYENRFLFNSTKIRNKVSHYSMERIVEIEYKQHLDKIIVNY